MKNYLGTVSVEPNGDGSTLRYHGSFEVTDEQREPATGFIKQIYTGAFENARQLLET